MTSDYSMQSIQDVMKDVQFSKNHAEQLMALYEKTLNYPEVQHFIQRQENISTDMIEKSFSKLYEFMQELERYKHGENVANPGFKPELFMNHHYIDVRYVPTQAYLQREKQIERAERLDNRMMGHDIRHAKLQDFFMNTSSRKTLIHHVTMFIEQFKKDKLQAKGLYISGPFGVGKTFLMGALANELANMGATVTMIHFPTYINDLKSTFNDPTTSTQEIIKQLYPVDVLIIDDIGAEANGPWQRDDVLTPILEYRMKESLPTFFTSNFNIEELTYHLANSAHREEPVKAQRIIERIRYLAEPLEFDGDNLRNP